jgi:hypothetical protein
MQHVISEITNIFLFIKIGVVLPALMYIGLEIVQFASITDEPDRAVWPFWPSVLYSVRSFSVVMKQIFPYGLWTFSHSVCPPEPMYIFFGVLLMISC